MTPPNPQTHRIVALLNEELALDSSRLIALRPGAWSSAYAFTSDDREWVVRFSEYPGDFDCDQYACRFASPDLPVPRVTQRGSWDGAHFCISERVSGGFFDDLTVMDLRETLPSLLGAFDALREADVSESTGYGGWDAEGNGTNASWAVFLWKSLQDSPEYRGGSWRLALEKSATGATSFDRDIRVLERRLDELPNNRHVIHSDLLNFNMFAENDEVSGVIDWGCALYGDFLYELSWFDFWWPWYQKWSDIDVAAEVLAHYESSGVDLHLAKERMLVYKLHIGLSHQSYNASIGNWAALDQVAQLTTSVADELR